MKCPNPQCKNTALDENHVFCFKCGCKILKAKEEPSSPSIDDNDTTPVTNAEFSDVQKDTDVSLDGGQRKRKDDGELEGKPAKRKSAATEDDSVPVGVDDVTATALQNLQLANNPSEVKQNTVPVTLLGLVPTTEHPLSDSRASDQSIKQASNTGYQPTAKESAIIPEVGSTCESERLLGASSTSSSDASMQQIQEENVLGRGENDVADSKPNKSTGSTERRQSNEDDVGDSDSTNGSDSEEDGVNQAQDKSKRSASVRKQKSASRIKKEKKKDKKKRREAEHKQAIQKERNGGNVDENNKDENQKEQKMTNENSTKANTKDQKSKGKGASKENKRTAQDEINNKKSTGFEGFGPDCKDNMTIIFHAVLAPHFCFEGNNGDRIFMRIGGLKFGEFNKDVLELKPVRNLDNDFLLVRGELRVPFGLVSGNVSYKYIVLRKGREKGEEDKYLWERIVHAGAYKNRCLCIPKDRCHIGGIWNQYDDAVFSEPNLFQSILNWMPVKKSMNVLEGRNLATWAMLCEWEDLLTGKSDTTMAAWDFATRVADLAYCMTNSKVEEYRLVTSNVPSRYNFKQILRDYLKPKIEQNATIQEVNVEDEKTRLSCLVVSVAICHIIASQKIQLDVEDYHRLFTSLSLWSDTEENTCSAFHKLLRNFPDAHWRELGWSIQAICRYAAKNHRDLNSWLFAVPLAHFLTQESEPFNEAVLLLETPRDGDDTWWGAGGFETKAVRDRTVGDDGCPSHMMKMLAPLFTLDPLFRRTFLLVVPCQAFGRIAASGIFTALEMCTTLARIVQHNRFMTQEEYKDSGINKKIEGIL